MTRALQFTKYAKYFASIGFVDAELNNQYKIYKCVRNAIKWINAFFFKFRLMTMINIDSSLRIARAKLILWRRDTCVAHTQAKFDKSAWSNYTIAGKLAIADYYLARRRWRAIHNPRLVFSRTAYVEFGPDGKHRRHRHRTPAQPALFSATPSLTGLYSYVPTVFLGVLRSRNTRRAIIFPSANKFSALLEHTAVAARLSLRDRSACNVTVSRGSNGKAFLNKIPRLNLTIQRHDFRKIDPVSDTNY